MTIEVTRASVGFCSVCFLSECISNVLVVLAYSVRYATHDGAFGVGFKTCIVFIRIIPSIRSHTRNNTRSPRLKPAVRIRSSRRRHFPLIRLASY